MTIDEYQALSIATAVYKKTVTDKLTYACLGLAGEAGELCNIRKKQLRDENYDRDRLVDELGDVLWYVAAVATELAVSLDNVASKNLAKLAARKEANTLHDVNRSCANCGSTTLDKMVAKIQDRDEVIWYRCPKCGERQS